MLPPSWRKRQVKSNVTKLNIHLNILGHMISYATYVIKPRICWCNFIVHFIWFLKVYHILKLRNTKVMPILNEGVRPYVLEDVVGTLCSLDEGLVVMEGEILGLLQNLMSFLRQVIRLMTWATDTVPSELIGNTSTELDHDLYSYNRNTSTELDHDLYSYNRNTSTELDHDLYSYNRNTSTELDHDLYSYNESTSTELDHDLYSYNRNTSTELIMPKLSTSVISTE